RLVAYAGAESCAFTDLPHDPYGGDVEDVHGETLLVGQHKRVGIHDAPLGGYGLVIGQVRIAHRVRIDVGITVINTIHPAFGHKQGIRVQLQRTLHGRVIGRDVGLADAARQQHNQATVQVT